MFDVLDILARGGGGGSGGGGGGSGIIVLPIILVGMFLTWRKRRQLIKKAKQKQTKALSQDHTWSNEIIQKRVKEVFDKFQEDWSTFNFNSMKTYLTPRYYRHIELMLTALKQMGRQNKVSDVQLLEQHLFGVEDHVDQELDTFNINIHAQLTDKLLDVITGSVLKSSHDKFEEVWHFEREGKNWALDSINQVDKNGIVHNFEPKINADAHAFAQKNSFYYNADFGWLLLPFEGILFSHSNYGTSDLNNHVIGMYRGVLVQFFQYIPLVSEKAKFTDNFKYLYRRNKSPFSKYLVAQATLPKSYDNIIVEKRDRFQFIDYTPGDMMKVSLEWPHFNKRFNVYATDIDKVNSLELLHPAFMEKLAKLRFEVNIEIVGNNLYLWTTDRDADYQMMLVVLQEAFSEMKM